MCVCVFSLEKSHQWSERTFINEKGETTIMTRAQRVAHKHKLFLIDSFAHSTFQVAAREVVARVLTSQLRVREREQEENTAAHFRAPAVFLCLFLLLFFSLQLKRCLLLSARALFFLLVHLRKIEKKSGAKKGGR